MPALLACWQPVPFAKVPFKLWQATLFFVFKEGYHIIYVEREGTIVAAWERGSKLVELSIPFVGGRGAFFEMMSM